jgi:hypothetical protein
MRWAAMLVLAAAGLVSGCAADPAPPAPAGPAPIQFFLRADLPLARAQINGVDVGFMLLDTGSSTTVLSKDVADRLHLPRRGSVHVAGIGGRVEAETCDLSDLRVGGHALGPRSATVIDLTPFSRNLGWPVAGIVGFDALRDKAFTLDLDAGTVAFMPLSPPPGAAVAELRMIGGLPAVPGRIGPGRAAWLQIDSGSNGSLALSLDAVRRDPGLAAARANTAGEATGVAGVGDLVQSRLVNLGVFGVDLSDVAMQVELPDRAGLAPTQIGDDSGGARLVGRMGNQILRRFRITFDLPHHRLWATPRPGPAGK